MKTPIGRIFLIVICVALVGFAIYLSIVNVEYFYKKENSTLLSIASFWITCIAFFISVWTLCVAKSIRKAKFDYVSQMQHINKRFALTKIIKQVEEINDKDSPLSAKYISKITEFIEHVKCENTCMAENFAQKKQRFSKIVQNPRTVNPGQLLIILQEIHDVMEQDNAAAR